METIVLPCISTQFVDFSITRTSVSSLLFAARHLQNDGSREALAGQFLNTFFIGVVCSIAKQKIGLVGAILVHIGFNLHAWQYMYNQNLVELVKKIKAIHVIDIIHPFQIVFVLGMFIDDALSPAILAYKGAKKIACLG